MDERAYFPNAKVSSKGLDVPDIQASREDPERPCWRPRHFLGVLKIFALAFSFVSYKPITLLILSLEIGLQFVWELR